MKVMWESEEMSNPAVYPYLYSPQSHLLTHVQKRRVQQMIQRTVSRARRWKRRGMLWAGRSRESSRLSASRQVADTDRTWYNCLL